MHAASGRLKDEDIVVKDECAATVIVSSGGYPGSYEKDKEISGLAEAGEDAIVFHCGTKAD
ncbi:MAG: phosphoribosylamine--glycine ligase, partial [Kiritimatiellae bacterium]|nr:phosphoribosylamine--glycine ligase [Kiritimatiellia bacterium]